MGRRVDVSQLVGASELAEPLGYQRTQDVHSLRRRDPTFPEPVARIGGGVHKQILVWYMPDVVAWARRKGIKLGSVKARKRAPRRSREDELVRMREELAELAELRERLGELSQLRQRLEALEEGRAEEDEQPSALGG